MNPTLERAAIAVWNPKAAGLRDDEIANVWLIQPDEERRLYFGIARAVLSAVREPVNTGSAVGDAIWRARIDAILADGGE